jgi:cell division protein FtsW
MSALEAKPAPAAKYLLLASTLLLSVGGLLMIYSASFAKDFIDLQNSYYHVQHQAVFLALGIVCMLVCMRLPVALVKASGWLILIASDLGLLAVYVIGVGKWGATRWIDLGFTTLQPSEFAKLGCVLVIAGILADRQRHPDRPLRPDLIMGAAAVLVPFVFVMLQPDMGTAMSILVSVFLVLLLGGLSGAYILGAVGIAAVAVPALVFVKPYRAERFLSFLDPSADPLGSGYQIIQARLAFGSGGILGLGLGMSRQKYLYLPAAHTDFIFAIIGEELGLLGTAAVVIAFGVLCYAGLQLALSTGDLYSRLVAGGLTAMIVTQALINMGSVTGLLPVTGVPLPLVSYGGSSLVFTLACIGLILGVTRNGSVVRSSKSALRREQ